MLHVDAKRVFQLAGYERLIPAIRQGFLSGVCAPARHSHAISVPGDADATLLLMPAWREKEFLGVKVATIYPSNADRGLPSVMASYLLLSSDTGQPLATIDGKSLTMVRTAATSALASKYLSRSDSRVLLMIGAGSMSKPLIDAHATVRPLENVMIWNRSRENAESLASSLREEAFNVEVVADLETAVHGADIISCATLSREPLISGDWVTPGTHLDLVGAFRNDMMEVDAKTLRRSSVYVDTLAGALEEAGDLVQAERSGEWSFDLIESEMSQICREEKSVRRSSDEITLFKSVGASIEDLATAVLIYGSAATV
jgi:ornithine cyclodeaminase/alanine dehydrogenase-like protein (mu-crystallin family)